MSERPSRRGPRDNLWGAPEARGPEELGGPGRYVGAMSEPPLGPSAVERALDLAFYAPFGLALSVVEAVP